MAGTTGAHDIGGLSVNAAIGVASGHKKYQLWELQTHCLVTLLSKCGLLTVDEVCLFAEIRPKVKHGPVFHLFLARTLLTK